MALSQVKLFRLSRATKQYSIPSILLHSVLVLFSSLLAALNSLAKDFQEIQKKKI